MSKVCCCAQEAAKRLGLSIEEYTRRADRINI